MRVSDMKHVYNKRFSDSNIYDASSIAEIFNETWQDVQPELQDMAVHKNVWDPVVEQNIIDEMRAENRAIEKELNAHPVANETAEQRYIRKLTLQSKIQRWNPEIDVYFESKKSESNQLNKKLPTYPAETNRRLQQQYLGYISHTEIIQRIPEDYIVYLFDFCGSWDSSHTIGVAVNPEHTHMIYFNRSV